MKTTKTFFGILTVITALATTGNCQTCVAVPAGAVSWWRAETNALDALDGNNGAVVGGVTYVAGEVGNAFSFAADPNSYVDVGNPTNLQLQNFTFEGWIQRASLADVTKNLYGDPTGNANIFAHGEGGYVFGLESNGRLFLGNFGLGQVDSAASVTDTTFHHVAVTKTGSTVVFYVDGVATAAPAFNTTFEFNSFACIGGDAQGGNTSGIFDGAIDEWTVYNQALSASQIQGIFAAGSAGKCVPQPPPPPPPPTSCVAVPPGAVSWWRAENNALDELDGNNGAVVGGVTYVAGEVGNAFSFAADPHCYVDVGNPANLQLQNFTFEGWIRRASLADVTRNLFGDPTGNANIFAHGEGGYVFGLESNGRLFLGNFGDDEVDSAASVTDTNFHHVAVTKNGSTVVFYVDGVATAAPAFDTTFEFNSFACIGGDAQGGNTAGVFDGAVDEWTVYNQALSASQIQGIFAAGSYGKCASPPYITAQPQPVVVHAHATASFSVTAVGAGPLDYQWSMNGTNISGANSDILTISNVVQADLGAYAVVVTNAFGVDTSSNAALSMYPYLAEPFDGLVAYWGQTNTLSVGAWGTGPLEYQWYDGGVAIPGATNDAFTITSVQFTNAGLYSVVVTSALGSVSNSAAQVVVEPAGVSLGFSPTVTISGVVGYNYIIQGSTALADPNAWVTLTNLTLTQPVQIWVDTSVNASSPLYPTHFYKVLPGN